MMQGTDLDWFRRLRAATPLEVTAAGGVTTMDEVRALLAMDVNVAVGMAMYTGRLSVEELAACVTDANSSAQLRRSFEVMLHGDVDRRSPTDCITERGPSNAKAQNAHDCEDAILQSGVSNPTAMRASEAGYRAPEKQQ